MCYTREGDAICCNERHPSLRWFQVEPYGKHGLLLFRITVVVVLVQQVVCHTVGGLLMLGFRCDPRFASFPVAYFASQRSSLRELAKACGRHHLANLSPQPTG